MLLVAPLHQLWACSCLPSVSPCLAAGRAAAAFTGTVLTITNPSFPPSPPPATGPIASARNRSREAPRFEPPVRTVRLRIGQSLSGIAPGQAEIEVVTGQGGGDCGYAFQTGAEYVVYAYRDSQGRLATGICSGTRPIAEAAEDLAYFRKMASQPATSELRVRTGHPDAPGPPGVVILAQGPTGLFTSQTDSTGIALFPHLPPGEYTIHQESHGDLPSDPKVGVSPKGCVELILLRFLELTGRVTTHDGKPAAGIELELRSPRGSEANARTNAEGQYQMPVAWPGQFQLGVNLTYTATPATPYPRWFYPGTQNPAEAATIEFSGKPETRVYDFALPQRLSPREIEGFVSLADGTPARVARLFVLDESKMIAASQTASPDGRFNLQVFSGVPYELHAVWPGNTPADALSAVPTKIQPGSGLLTLRLTLDQPGNSFADATRPPRR